MKLLELFKGTGSVGKAALAKGYGEVISLDIRPECAPDICTDLMTWDYRSYPVGYFDVIWASPPCTEYSTLQNMNAKTPSHVTLEARRVEADRIVGRVLEVIEYLKPRFWFIENPWTGALKSRAIMKELPYVDGDYCQYGYPYRKRTRFWTNRRVALRTCELDCPWSSRTLGRHLTGVAPKGASKLKEGEIDIREVCRSLGLTYGQDLKYSIPQGLLEVLLPPERVRPFIKIRKNPVSP